MFAGTPRSGQHHARRQALRTRLALESLESRRLMAFDTLANPDAFGPILIDTPAFEGNIYANDDNPDGALTYTQPVSSKNPLQSVGSVTIDEVTGDFVFSPDPGFTGTALFSYTLDDGVFPATTARVSILVSRAAINEDGDLVVMGTDTSDRIVINFVSANNTVNGIQAIVNNVKYTTTELGPTNRVLVYGLEGNDTISVGSALGTFTSVEIILDGGEGNDYLMGSRGNDTLIGGLGNDRLVGGDGDDLIFGDEAVDGLPVPGDGGNDTVTAGKGNDIVYGQEGNDQLNGEAGDDILYGDDGNDRLNGGAGTDRLFGGLGLDYLDGGNDSDLLHGGGDSDQLYGRSGNDVLIGGTEGDSLIGGNQNDFLLGDDLAESDADDLFTLYWLPFTTGAVNAINANIVPLIVTDDAMDTLLGETGTDWFFAYWFDGEHFDVLRDFKMSQDLRSLNGTMTP